MKTIQTTVLIGSDRKFTVELPEELDPGNYRVVVVIDDVMAEPIGVPHPSWPSHELGRWPYSPVLHREELYGQAR